MRLWITFILCAATLGCGSVGSRTEREIALLRAEILDLGDQYGDLKSRHRRALADLATCQGEPVSDYFPDSNATYYEPMGGFLYSNNQTVGNGFVHSGTPDCCADCNRIYHGYGGGEIIDNGVILGPNVISNESPVNLHPLQTNPILNNNPANDPIVSPFEDSTQPAADPIGSPFKDSTWPAGDILDPVEGQGMTNGQPQSRERFLARQAELGWTQRAKSNINNRVADVEPAFRPNDSQWTQRNGDQLPLEDSVPDLVIQDNADTTSNGQPWQQASGPSQRALSSTPLDDRYLDDEFLEMPKSSATVEQIFIDPENSFANDYDKDGGDDGIRLLIQPLDVNGDIVNRGARMIVSVIDANEIGEKQRIGLWKYEAYQTESFVSNERGRRGLVLDLPWQRRTPQNRNLIVFVRFITDSGRKLETSLDVEINPPTEKIEDFEMLDPMAAQRRSAPKAKSADNAQLPKWRPVR